MREAVTGGAQRHETQLCCSRQHPTATLLCLPASLSLACCGTPAAPFLLLHLSLYKSPGFVSTAALLACCSTSFPTSHSLSLHFCPCCCSTPQHGKPVVLNSVKRAEALVLADPTANKVGGAPYAGHVPSLPRHQLTSAHISS
jgi:hypothetical protein